jgi:hypothetical protein
MVPGWFHDLSIAYLSLGGACTLLIVLDLVRHPQHMWIMNLVWPITALFGTVVIARQYFAYGRLASHQNVRAAMQRGDQPPNKRSTPFRIKVANGTLHCGSGCVLGDISAEWMVSLVPAIAATFGFRRLFDDRIFAAWILDYIMAYLFGILFQYFTIAPMRGLSLGRGLIAAIKADTLSLTAWQIGMYGFMAIANFLIFQAAFGTRLQVDSFEFWFMMQIAMVAGFLTSYPVNWWLLRQGLKEPM